MNQIAIAGNKGKGVRSDCFITLELTKQGGITVDIVSKVKVLYGRQIEEQIKNILSFYEIKNAKVSIEDSGAISLVIAARMEACIKRLIKTDKEYLMPFLPDNKYTTPNPCSVANIKAWIIFFALSISSLSGA
jgi:citrate lyase acyl carrier protein